MSKKDKKIEIQVKDAKVTVNKAIIEGFELVVGKENVAGFHKKMDQAVAAIIEAYNLNH